MRINQHAMATGIAAVILVFAGQLYSPPATASSIIHPGRTAQPAGGTVDRGFGINGGNTNAQLAERIPKTLRKAWTRRFTACTQGVYGAIKDIAITEGHVFLQHTRYACPTTEGMTLDGKGIWSDRPSDSAGRLTVTNSRVYVPYLLHASTQDGTNDTHIEAVSSTHDILGGDVLWSGEAADDVRYDSDEPYFINRYTTSVAAGLMTTGTSISDANTGKWLFDLPLGATADRGKLSELGVTGHRGGVAFISPTRIVYNSNTDVEAFTLSGEHLWTYVKTGGQTGAGYGHANPTLNQGHLFIPNDTAAGTASTLVLNAATGQLERTLPGSTSPLAIDGHTMIVTSSTNASHAAALTAIDTTTGHRYWTHPLKPLSGQAGLIASGPVIENGLVWFQTGNTIGSPGKLASLSETTGRTASVYQQKCAASGSNIAIGQGLLAVGSVCGVVVYRPA